jgi:hypothetical protein
MSKEEIIKTAWDEKYSVQPYEKNHLKRNYEDVVFRAMEEYAKQVNSEAIDLLRTIYVKNRHDMGLDEDISSFFEKIGEEL